MKKTLQLLILVLFILLNSCFSLPDLGDMSIGDKLSESVSSSMGLDSLASEMQAFQFYTLYMSYAFIGGYSYETGFAEGQGLRWKYTTAPSNGEIRNSEYERVFLKDMKDGTSWWRLSAESEDETYEYEYLTDMEMNILLIRFRDSDTNEIVEYRPPAGDESDDDSDDGEGLSEESEMTLEEYESYNDYEYEQYSAGNEKITVPAGTFTAEHMVSEVSDKTDPDNPVDMQTDWWIVESVPGGVIKYVWLDKTDSSTLDSELMAVLEDQKTTMSSY